MKTESNVASLFQQAVKYENERQYDEAARLYEQIIALEPDYAAAHINLGTAHYFQRRLQKAKMCYLAAIKVAPKDALAHFDLANVLDELDNQTAAIAHYETALALVPTYANAHYNLALTLEKVGQSRKALPHWRKYAQLDVQGAWHAHALGRIRAILENHPLQIVHRKATPTRTKPRANLELVVGAE